MRSPRVERPSSRSCRRGISSSRNTSALLRPYAYFVTFSCVLRSQCLLEYMVARIALLIGCRSPDYPRHPPHSDLHLRERNEPGSARRYHGQHVGFREPVHRSRDTAPIQYYRQRHELHAGMEGLSLERTSTQCCSATGHVDFVCLCIGVVMVFYSSDCTRYGSITLRYRRSPRIIRMWTV